jgi:hypothetical protein
LLPCLVANSLYGSIIKLQRFIGPTRHPRTDMWVAKDVGMVIAHSIQNMTKNKTSFFVCTILKASFAPASFQNLVLSNWRMALWQPWQTRHSAQDPHTIIEDPAKELGKTFLMINVNGWHSKWLEVLSLFQSQQVLVGAVQETLVSWKHYLIQLSGYVTFTSP